MTRAGYDVFGLLAVLIAMASLLCAQPTYAQDPVTPGSIAGTVRNIDGKPISNWVCIYSDGAKLGETTSNSDKGGSYTVPNLHPGIYEMRISEGGSDGNSRPLRLWGVVVKPGARTIQNIVTQRGDQLEEIGTPSMTSKAASSGWLEGNVFFLAGYPVGDWVAVYQNGVQVAQTSSDEHMGGLYVIRDLPPGVYDLRLSRGPTDNVSRPLHISGVVVKPGVRSILRIVTFPGDQLQEIGCTDMKVQNVPPIEMGAAHADVAFDNAKTVDKIPFVNGAIIVRGGMDPIAHGVLADQSLPGNTHIEAYFNWADLEPQKDHWVTAGFDAAIELARKHGLKMEFLPCFVPPAWFKQTPDYAPLINSITGQILPHTEQWMPNMSPWAPGTFKGHEHLYAYIAQHYKGQIDIIKFYTEVGLWVNAAGYWCGDPYARADFKERMLAKYGSLAALNIAWGTSFHAPESIVYPDQENRYKESHRWIDYMTWFHDSQIRAEVKELQSIRKYFPTTLVSIPLGYGSDDQSAGSDRTAAVRAAAAYGPVSIRSTHGSFNRGEYPMAYWFYKRMAPLCHDLNIGFGTEPPSGDLSYNEIRRQEFEDASAGANFIFTYWQNFHLRTDPSAPPHIIEDYKQILRPYERSLVDIGVLYPTTQMQLDIVAFPKDQLAFCDSGREHFDYDLLDENLIDWGYLNRYKILLHTSGSVYRAETLPAIGNWIKAGGILVTRGLPQWTDIDGHKDVAQSWLTSPSPAAPGVHLFALGKGRIYAVDEAGEQNYLAKVIAILTSVASTRPARSPIHGFKAQSDGRWMTEFPDGRLVFNPATFNTAFVPARKKL